MVDIINVSEMKDVQKTEPELKIYIPNVGVENIILPVLIKTMDNKIQSTIASINVYIDLESDKKGIHMSRLVSIMTDTFHSSKTELTFDIMKQLCEQILEKCEAHNARIEFKFPYFVEKITPVSNLVSLSKYDILFKIETRHVSQFMQHNELRTHMLFVPTIEVTGIGTSSCPCSREISTDGAHNQRSKIKLACGFDFEFGIVYIENLIDIIEKSFSCEIYNILKRPDEKYVTEKAYAESKFVEDIYRFIYSECKAIEYIRTINIHVSNEESIHQHNAVATIGF